MPPLPSPHDSTQTAEREWPGLRSRLIDVAASLDRLEAAGATNACADANDLLRELLTPSDSPRTDRLLRRLSRPYDPAWKERFASGEKSID